MPRVITETRLAANLSIRFVRYQPRTPEGQPSGPLTWAVGIEAVVLDQAGEVVRQVSVANIMDDLTAAERNSLTALANKMAQKLAQRLDITEQ